MDQYEEKVAAALVNGDKDTAALAGAVGLGEHSVRHLVARLAASGFGSEGGEHAQLSGLVRRLDGPYRYWWARLHLLRSF